MVFLLKLSNKSKKRELSNIYKGILALAKGAILARLLGLLSIPLLTRIYSPEDYGVLALYTAFVTILSPMITLRYVQAIPLPRTDSMAINLFFMCLKLIFVGLLVISITLYFFGEIIFVWFDLQALSPWWPLIAIGVASSALYELFSLWATRKRNYKVLANAQIQQSFMGNTVKIVLGLFGLKTIGLLIGQAFNQGSGTLSLIRQFLKEFDKLKSKVSRQRIFFIALYYKSFPFYRLPSQILMVVSVQAPVFMMASLYGKEITGQFSLAMMALSLPVSLIGAAVSRAYYAEIAALGKNSISEIKKITSDVQKKLFLIGLPLTVVVLLFAESGFILVFGTEWGVAGDFARVLAPFILFQFTSAPLMEALNVVGSQLNFLFIQTLRAIGLVFLYFILKVKYISAFNFVIAISAYLSLFYLFASLFVMFVLIRKNKKHAA